ncbi:aldo/keto reductase [Bifidobacterium eulemuris]|uniref:Aldo/keto reductase n=1 Tax=Bifidobacterium eulemuris TaxID=1765219 RepID=A0A261G3C9_9BIFI|nr:aldo/keto reductase [Bifidobacterium eulemuris]OZG65934.1 aldo/keto reductase [Bifidobacterium eulemuris]QOL32000.1 aldo/keto reductase [Bifidobacterium eulemuris]
MKTIEIGTSGVHASQVALGVMRMDALDPGAAATTVRAAVELGVNFFDTADIYGFTAGAAHASSRTFGRAWRDAGVKREDILIQTKFGIVIDYDDPQGVRALRYDFSAAHLVEALERELEALGTDYVDFALLHRPDTLMEPDEVAEAFDILQSSGKVRHFGVSNMGPWQVELLQASLGQKLEANQLQFGLMHARMVSDEMMVNSTAEGMAPANHSDGLLSYSRLRRMTIQAWSPFQSGTEFGPFVGNPHFAELNAALDAKAAKYGVSANAIATAWILRHPANIQAVLGSMSLTRLGEMLDGADITLDRQDWWDLYVAAGNLIP